MLTSKHWGAIIGVVLVVIGIWLSPGAAAVAILGGLIGYFVGMFLEGQLDIEDIRARVQGRNRIR